MSVSCFPPDDPSYFNHVPMQPIMQVKGTDPLTGDETFYRIDNLGFVLDYFDKTKNDWVNFKTCGIISYPSNVVPAMTDADWQTAFQIMQSMQLLKPYTPYIAIGDEPPTGLGTVNLASQMSPDKVQMLKSLFSFLPREFLRQWYEQNIRRSLSDLRTSFLPNFALTTYDMYGNFTNIKPSDLDIMMWASIIDLFNQANSDYVRGQGITPWAWERQKLEQYYHGAAADAYLDFQKRVQDYKPEAQMDRAADLLQQFAALPKLGDQGQEITRQNAVNELMKQGEFDLVQEIINAYHYADQTPVGEALKKPIPFSFTTPEGRAVSRT